MHRYLRFLSVWGSLVMSVGLFFAAHANEPVIVDRPSAELIGPECQQILEERFAFLSPVLWTVVFHVESPTSPALQADVLKKLRESHLFRIVETSQIGISIGLENFALRSDAVAFLKVIGETPSIAIRCVKCKFQASVTGSN